MTGPLDMMAELLLRLLGGLAPETAAVLFVPLFVVVVATAFVVFVRTALEPLCRAASFVLRTAFTLAGAVVLLGEMTVAGGYRRRGVRPPAVVYNVGDIVASWVTAASSGATRATTALARAARLNAVLLILVSLAWIWLWNDGYCPDEAASCARPVATWYDRIGDG
ncbi:hypothetical protein [Actinoplanes sp. NPDC051494]|uniref:hypothetical protein n=1 Tax=Actinoplanes sp. NPDC051494 TaxID=3363907 RepID=UPI0037B9D023